MNLKWFPLACGMEQDHFRHRAVPYSCRYLETFVLQHSILQSSAAYYILAYFTHQFKILHNNEYCLMWKSNGNFPCLLTAESSGPCLYLMLLLTCTLPSLPRVAQRVLGTML